MPMRDSTHDRRVFFLCFLSKEWRVATWLYSDILSKARNVLLCGGRNDRPARVFAFGYQRGERPRWQTHASVRVLPGPR